MNAPDPATVRKIAENAMRGAIRDDMFWQVNQAVIEHGVPGPASKGSTFEAHRSAAIAEYKRMADALEGPDEQPQDSEIAAERALAFAAAAYAEAKAATAEAAVLTPAGHAGPHCRDEYDPGCSACQAEQPQDDDVQVARAWLADLSENIRSYHQSIPGQPGCTCGRSLACGNDVPDYAAIWTLEAALDAWMPAEADEQSQNERDAQLADLATELDAANDNADEIADRAGKYREEIMRLRAERDEARELACVSLDILKNVSDEPMRELFGVDDFGEMPEWFTGYGKPSTGALDAHNANGGE